MTNVHRIGLARDLYLRGQTGRPIRIGLIGCGEMGTDILSQVAHMQGITVAAVADTRQGRVSKASQMATGEAGHVKNCDSAASLIQRVSANSDIRSSRSQSSRTRGQGMGRPFRTSS